MLLDLAWFLGGVALLLLGGESMIKGVAGVALRAGVSPFKAGLYVLAFATSIPELAVNAYAVAHGQPELALGNAVGSNIVNVGLTLGAAALAAPLLVRLRVVSAQIGLLLVATGLVLFFGLDGQLARWEGGVLLAGFLGVVVFVALRSVGDEAEVVAELNDFVETPAGFGRNLARIAVAGVVLYFGARWIVDAAPALGRAFGMSPLVLGLVPVAIATALPEVVMAVLAARAGQGNVVAGHVMGASLFNLLLVVGGMALLRPLAVPTSLVAVELPAAMAFALALYPLLAGDLRLSRREGAVLFAGFLAWVAYELATLYA